MKLKVLYIVILVALAFVACKSDEQTNWDVDVLTPLVKTRLSIQNIISDSLLQSNSDHSISVSFNDTVFSLEFDSIFKVPDTVISTFFKSPLWATIGPGLQFMNRTDNVKFKIPDAQISNITIKTGKIKYFIQSTISEKTKFYYQIPRATKNGIPLTIIRYIPGKSGGVNGSLSGEIDLSGYDLDLRGASLNIANTIQTITKVYNDSSSNPINITPNDSIKFNMTYQDLVPDYAKGYFGQQNQASGLKSTNFDIFKNIVSGNINMSNVKLSVSIINYLGIDARIILKSLISKNSRNGNSIDLNSQIINKHINITRAKDIGNNSGGIQPTILKLDIEPQAAKEFIENLPDLIKYNLDMMMNPLGNISGGNDFVYYGKGFMVLLNFDMPLTFSSNSLAIADTVDFSFKEKDFENLNGGKLNIIANNTFPIQAKLAMILLDENKQIIEKINLSQAIEASESTQYSENLIPKKSILPISITSTRIDNFKRTKYVAFAASFTSIPANQHITIYDNNYLDIKLTGDFSYNINN